MLHVRGTLALASLALASCASAPVTRTDLRTEEEVPVSSIETFEDALTRERTLHFVAHVMGMMPHHLDDLELPCVIERKGWLEPLLVATYDEDDRLVRVASRYSRPPEYTHGIRTFEYDDSGHLVHAGLCEEAPLDDPCTQPLAFGSLRYVDGSAHEVTRLPMDEGGVFLFENYYDPAPTDPLRIDIRTRVSIENPDGTSKPQANDDSTIMWSPRWQWPRYVSPSTSHDPVIVEGISGRLLEYSLPHPTESGMRRHSTFEYDDSGRLVASTFEDTSLIDDSRVDYAFEYTYSEEYPDRIVRIERSFATLVLDYSCRDAPARGARVTPSNP